MSPYSISSLEESVRNWESNFKEKRAKYWIAIKEAYNDYETNENHGYYEPNLNSFRYWMEHRWGVKIEVIDGHIGPNYSVADEGKYILFMLRYRK